MVHLPGVIDADTALFFRTFFAISRRPWSPSSPPRTPRKIGRLSAGQAAIRGLRLAKLARENVWIAWFPFAYDVRTVERATEIIRRAR